MAENQDGQEKTHDPSQKKLEEAAEKGEIAMSSEVSAALVIICGAGALAFFGGPLAGAFRTVCDLSFRVDRRPHLDEEGAMLLGAQVMREIAVAISVPLSAILVGAIIAGVAQSRFQLAPKALEWKAERLNFAAGFQRMFLSSQPLMELAKSLGKLFLLSWVTWMAVSSRLDMLPSIATVGSIQLFRIMVDLGLTVVMYAIPLLLVLAAADYSYQHWRTNEDQKMTLKEVKDERKDQDGDPIVKAARRARAREYSMGNLLSKVREADVVVTNPTHYAVAIKYDKSVAPAPIILAMGVDHMALKIRQEAMRFDVPRVENRSLARALYATGKLHKIIPDELYGPVAQVLATIYKRRMKRRIRMGNQGMTP